jgi:hypothetical protein
MLPRYLPKEDELDAFSWQDLAHGAPTLLALARLCGRALSSESPVSTSIHLMPEALAILYAARNSGVIEIRHNHLGFDATERFLAVYVEQGPDRYLAFKNREEPEKTIRFLEGFRQLCKLGLVMHHAVKDFSLTLSGFEKARSIDPALIAAELNFAVDATRRD